MTLLLALGGTCRRHCACSSSCTSDLNAACCCSWRSPPFTACCSSPGPGDGELLAGGAGAATGRDQPSARSGSTAADTGLHATGWLWWGVALVVLAWCSAAAHGRPAGLVGLKVAVFYCCSWSSHCCALRSTRGTGTGWSPCSWSRAASPASSASGSSSSAARISTSWATPTTRSSGRRRARLRSFSTFDQPFPFAFFVLTTVCVAAPTAIGSPIACATASTCCCSPRPRRHRHRLRARGPARTGHRRAAVRLPPPSQGAVARHRRGCCPWSWRQDASAPPCSRPAA